MSVQHGIIREKLALPSCKGGHLTYLLIKILYSTLKNTAPSQSFTASQHMGEAVAWCCHSYNSFNGPLVHIPELSDQALTLEMPDRCQTLLIHII